jgi:radical SAM protein with 4Fe4S-binding SPASM domain
VSQTPVRLTRRGALAALKGLRQPGNVPLVSDTTAEAAHLAGSSDVDRGGACWAPHGSMYFDQRGDVRACCQNTHVVLGNVTKQSLHEIWRSADAERMRTALEQHDYSQGCEFCEWQVREGNAQIVFARNFDQLRPIHANRSDWPSMMEFSLTNTCNLQCVMCSGEFSSAIRAQREHKQPLPKVYGEEFFEQLAEFLPHLSEARFLGGEPFLGREPLRVLDMLADLDDPPAVAITTNGTVFNAKVAAILDQLRPSIVVSIDAATAATFEAIRVGASFSEVIGNIERFCNAVGPSRVSLAHCLMTTNWSEFADLLEFAEHRGMEVGVNIVRFPAEHSLYHLEADELGPIVDVLHGTTVSLTGARAEVWDPTARRVVTPPRRGPGRRRTRSGPRAAGRDQRIGAALRRARSTGSATGPPGPGVERRGPHRRRFHGRRDDRAGRRRLPHPDGRPRRCGAVEARPATRTPPRTDLPLAARPPVASAARCRLGVVPH